jgi:putative ATP-dependent endonuclease of OLD family
MVVDLTEIKNVFLSKIDLEHDLADELPGALLSYTGKEDIVSAIKYLQSKKAVRMREFILRQQDVFKTLNHEGGLLKPLFKCLEQAG